MKKTGIFAILTSAAVMLSAAGCATSGTNGGSGVAIEVGGHKISMADVSVKIQDYTAYGLEFDKAKDMAVQELKETFEYEALAKKMGIELTDEDKDSIIMQKANMVQRSGMKYSEYADYLAKAGSDIKFIEDCATAEAYKSKLTAKMTEGGEDMSVSTEEMGEFLKSDYYRAKHILIAEPTEGDAADSEVVTEEDGKTGEELANLVLEKAKNGENFDDMIKKYNTDPGMESNADGYVFTDGAMVAEFEDCVKSLKPGEFGLAKTDYGYHVIERLSLDGTEEKFESWVTENKDDLEFKALCKKNGIEVKLNQDVIDGYTESQMVKPDTDE